MKSLPGWTINIDEIYNGVIKVILTDAYGRKAEVTDNDTDETIDKAIGYAFDIEKQVSANWNKFLYDCCLQKINLNTIIEKEYNVKAFGSWFVEFRDKRIVYDGKDSWLISQEKIGSAWEDKIIIKNNELTYSNFIGLIQKA